MPIENNVVPVVSPILFLIFNRPETTRVVFAAIKKAKPTKLYIAADGPRETKPGESERCEKTRAIIKEIDWECEVKTLFREENLGCREAVSGAIDWFFDNEEQGIILEDDCLPSQSFFPYCSTLLERYKNDDRIALISGDNFRPEEGKGADYYATRIPHIWGWATWRRIWQKYDVRMDGLNQFVKEDGLKKIWPENRVRKYWQWIFDAVKRGEIDTWDYQLAFLVFNNELLCLCPNKNLVSNIGFGVDFTNTLIQDSRVASLLAQDIGLPLSYPEKLEYKVADDSYVSSILLKNFHIKLFLKRLHVFDLIKKIYVMFYLRKR